MGLNVVSGAMMIQSRRAGGRVASFAEPLVCQPSRIKPLEARYGTGVRAHPAGGHALVWQPRDTSTNGCGLGWGREGGASVGELSRFTWSTTRQPRSMARCAGASFWAERPLWIPHHQSQCEASIIDESVERGHRPPRFARRACGGRVLCTCARPGTARSGGPSPLPSRQTRGPPTAGRAEAAGLLAPSGREPPRYVIPGARLALAGLWSKRAYRGRFEDTGTRGGAANGGSSVPYFGGRQYGGGAATPATSLHSVRRLRPADYAPRRDGNSAMAAAADKATILHRH